MTDQSDRESATSPGTTGSSDFVSLGVEHPIWNRFFHVAPLIVVGTRETHGGYDLAPKHMAAPMGWGWPWRPG